MSVAIKKDMTPVLHRTTYDRGNCKTGIVHLGYGAFHRAHQAVFVDDYMEQTGDLNWGIAAVNLRASESEVFAASQKPTNGYLLKTIAPDQTMVMRLVRSHTEYIDWSKEAEGAEALVSRADVHMITITVTESGYFLTGGGDLDLDAPIIAAEIDGGGPHSVYAYLARALNGRALCGTEPITILCCDNVRSNGRMLQRNFLSYLNATGREDLARWVEAYARFPCSMVDRITPRATETLDREVSEYFGGLPLDPIHGEAFIQWVLEDNFAGPMPALDLSGVEIVNDVDPYEEAKIRILNGGHTGLAYLGALAGYTTFDEAMHDQKLLAHFDKYQKHEVLPGLTFELPFNKTTYLDQIKARFGNREIADQLERICMDGYSKMQIYIRPTIRACLQQGIVPVHGFDCIASWYVYARRFKAGAMPVHYHEPYWEKLSPFLEPGQEEKLARLSNLWGSLPDRYDTFVPGLVSAIHEMEKSWPVLR